MGRLMSVTLTEDAVRARAKTVTRRVGWWTDRRGRRLLAAGDELVLCRKVMGRRPDEPLQRLARVVVLEVTREPLHHITHRPGDVAREGFPTWTTQEFLDFFTTHMHCQPDAPVTRIRWHYLDGSAP